MSSVLLSVQLLHRKRAGKTKLEFLREHFLHLREKVNFLGIGRGSPQKLHLF